ncbi:hypothetical protein SAZ_14915 [Streptomyces noursei ZPM]|uniref:Uncharacterized protein n=1 Tax=Streptomyces noursei TaxID=1971 RepID=A0A401QZT1_STRNR|nr:DUF6284 family protein [Streptomyces noursei]AKA03601.1 hypothetical protein SAZ_14915 [Streptomyces noursei ZPM]EOS98401.1 hypothetical protein K530_39131 [Streptomyces noursei CCRC 11814]EXU86285.1 hypothetical protein P354_02580 [Streptomyces noursei PD-1]UWS71984.1 DUF6284 family protein [Streptomyces noursei]GCB90862.1 hypothetical protein SALB_03570 [Streptomyces noursei]
MSTIIALAPDPDREPTAAELDAIAAETPFIDAEVELLNEQIALLDRTPTELDRRRVRRAEDKVLAAWLALVTHLISGEAA